MCYINSTQKQRRNIIYKAKTYRNTKFKAFHTHDAKQSHTHVHSEISPMFFLGKIDDFSLEFASPSITLNPVQNLYRLLRASWLGSGAGGFSSDDPNCTQAVCAFRTSSLPSFWISVGSLLIQGVTHFSELRLPTVSDRFCVSLYFPFSACMRGSVLKVA